MRRLILSTSLIWMTIFALQAQYNTDINQEILKKYKGDILFSKTQIDLNTYKETSQPVEFDLLDNIYAQVVLGKTLSQIYSEHNYVYDYDNTRYDYNYAMELYVDGDKKARWLFELPENFYKYALTFDLYIANDDPQIKNDYSFFVNQWVNIISQLKEGKRKMRIDIIPLTMDMVGDDLPVIASGTFILNVDKDKMKEFVERKATDLPPATMVNKYIEAMILRASEDIYPHAEPLRAFITDIDEDWKYSTDENGNILYRNIVASVVYKINTSNQCWVKSGIYSQKHQGFGSFGPMNFYKETNGYYDYEIPCSKVE